MAYQPTRQIIESGFANTKFTGPDSSQEGWNQLARNYLATQERKYKETNDYYDIQREEMNSLASVLNGTYGKDNSYLNQLVLDARDEYKEVLKGTKLKDYRSPAIQDKLFQIKNRLSQAKNLSATSLDQITKSYTAYKANPSMIGKEVETLLMSELNLPPDKRNPNIFNEVMTNPLFLNAYDHLVGVFDEKKRSNKIIQKKSTDGYFFESYKAEFAPELGYFDADDNWVFDPQDQVLDEVLQTISFYNKMEGMLPASLVKGYKDTGNGKALAKEVREQTKRYMNEVFVREEGGQKVGPYDPKLTLEKRTMDPAKYDRLTVAEKTDKKFEEEVGAIQQRLIDNNPLAFNEYISPDGWRSFAFEYDEDGKISGIIGTIVDKSNIMYGKTMGEQPTKADFIPVDVNDAGSVRQALSRIKFVFNKDKTKVSATPLQKPDNKEKPKIQGF